MSVYRMLKEERRLEPSSKNRANEMLNLGSVVVVVLIQKLFCDIHAISIQGLDVVFVLRAFRGLDDVAIRVIRLVLKIGHHRHQHRCACSLLRRFILFHLCHVAKQE